MRGFSRVGIIALVTARPMVTAILFGSRFLVGLRWLAIGFARPF